MNRGNTSKSALVAGILGIILGAFGVHDWYLDDQKKAKKHIILVVIWIILLVISIIFRTFAPSTGSLDIANIFNSIATTTYVLSWITILANVTWGIIDGVLLLVQGDAGLAARGYMVANNSVSAESTSRPTTVEGQHVNPASEATPLPNSPTTPSAPANTPAQPILPPAPTLAEQALGSQQPTPIVFNSANIQQSTSLDSLSQPLGTKNVQAPALVVQNSSGKTTMNPVVLRRVLVVGIILVAAVIIAIVVKNGVSTTIASGYGATYRAAKELAPKITNTATSTSCEYATTYVKSVAVDKSTYDGYINNCKSLASGIDILVEQLGQTPAIGWNSELSAAYQDFHDLYFESFPGGEQSSQLIATLDLYQAWHSYLVAVDRLTVDSPDSEFQQAADILRTSGNETLAKYGEEWLAKELDYLDTYRRYWNLSYTDPEKSNLRTEYETKRENLRNWVSDHRPDVTKLASFDIPDLGAMQASFAKLYDLIKSAYESHYDYSSSDCNQAGNVVYCS